MMVMTPCVYLYVQVCCCRRAKVYDAVNVIILRYIKASVSLFRAWNQGLTADIVFGWLRCKR